MYLVNRLPTWALHGEKRPPEWLRTYFPNLWKEEFINYGEPGEYGKYLAEETMKKVRTKLKLQR